MIELEHVSFGYERDRKVIDDLSFTIADGEAVAQVRDGEEVVVEKAPVTVPLVELPGADPFEVLSRKLGWAGSSIR